MDVYYKVLRVIAGMRQSTFAPGKLLLEYPVGVWVRPIKGKIFIFNSYWQAKHYAAALINDMSRIIVVPCYAVGVEEQRLKAPNIKSLAKYASSSAGEKTLDRYWKAVLSGVNPRIRCGDWIYAWPGSCLADAIKCKK